MPYSHLLFLFACKGKPSPTNDTGSVDPTTPTDPGDDSGTTVDTDTNTDTGSPTKLGCKDGWAALSAGKGYATIQGAMDGAVDGGTVEICPGTHLEVLELENKSLTFEGWSGDAEDTVLDGGGKDPIFLLDGGQFSFFDLTLQNGDGTASNTCSAIHCLNCNLALHRMVIRGNNGPGSAACATSTLDTAGYTLEVRDSHFENNATTAGVSGLGLTVPQFSADSATEVIVDNTVFKDHSQGTALTLSPDIPMVATVSNSLFEGNVGDQTAGLTCGSFSSCDLRLENVDFVGNASESDGAAIDMGGWDDNRLTLHNVLFDSNYTSGDAGAVKMSGRETCYLEIDTSSFVDNTAEEGAGALEVMCNVQVEVKVNETTFVRNKAGSGYGGAISFLPDGNVDVTVTSSEFIDNEAGKDGGAVFLENGGTTATKLAKTSHWLFEDVTFTDNLSKEGSGALEFNCGPLGEGYLTIRDSTFLANTAAPDVYGPAALRSYSSPACTAYTTLENIEFGDNKDANDPADLYWDCDEDPLADLGKGFSGSCSPK